MSKLFLSSYNLGVKHLELVAQRVISIIKAELLIKDDSSPYTPNKLR